MAQARKRPNYDLNHSQVVKYVKSWGGTVLDTAALPNAFDILVGFMGFNIIIEIKSTKPREAEEMRKDLTPGEDKFSKSWIGGPYHMAYNLNDIDEIFKAYREYRRKLVKNNLWEPEIKSLKWRYKDRD